MTTNLKQKTLYIISIIILLGFIIFSMMQTNKNKSVSQTYFYMGTIIDITIYGTEDTTHLNNISKIINDLDHTFSRNIEESEVSRINDLNKNTNLIISKDTFNVIEASLKYSELSNGYFDITINPLVELWGIGTENQKVPEQAAIDTALKDINYNNIELDKNDSSITLLNENTTLDLGAIAKGYVADEIVKYLKENKIERALISLGGNVYALGNSTENKPWNIGIRHPDNEISGAILSLSLENKSVVTSGVYERYFEEDNIIYHHILNPFTGYPVSNAIQSLTIVSNTSIDGDALSTSMFCLGKDEALKVINSMENIEVIIITNDKKIYITSGLKGLYNLLDDEYEILMPPSK